MQNVERSFLPGRVREAWEKWAQVPTLRCREEGEAWSTPTWSDPYEVEDMLVVQDIKESDFSHTLEERIKED